MCVQVPMLSSCTYISCDVRIGALCGLCIVWSKLRLCGDLFIFRAERCRFGRGGQQMPLLVSARGGSSLHVLVLILFLIFLDNLHLIRRMSLLNTPAGSRLLKDSGVAPSTPWECGGLR